VSEEVITHSAEETTQWGREFAKRLQAPVLVLLTGDLGSGKTTLTKGIVAGLGAASEDDVTSPTFTLVHVYGSARDGKVYHADLYRIESFHDFETLAWKMSSPGPPWSSLSGPSGSPCNPPGLSSVSNSSIWAATPAASKSPSRISLRTRLR